MSSIEVFECNAEAIVCGETYDVKIVTGPDDDNLCKVDIPFASDFVERVAVLRSNIFPRDEVAVSILMGV